MAYFSQNTLLTKWWFCAIIYIVRMKNSSKKYFARNKRFKNKKGLNKHKHKHMRQRQWVSETQSSEYSLVYYYLLAGISLMLSVFLFLPRVSTGWSFFKKGRTGKSPVFCILLGGICKAYKADNAYKADKAIGNIPCKPCRPCKLKPTCICKFGLSKHSNFNIKIPHNRVCPNFI